MNSEHQAFIQEKFFSPITLEKHEPEAVRIANQLRLAIVLNFGSAEDGAKLFEAANLSGAPDSLVRLHLNVAKLAAKIQRDDLTKKEANKFGEQINILTQYIARLDRMLSSGETIPPDLLDSLQSPFLNSDEEIIISSLPKETFENTSLDEKLLQGILLRFPRRI